MAPINPRPRSYAERPSGPLAPKPANDNVLGTWENGVFHFASPEAKEKWRRKSFEQGVGEDVWHLGKEIDPQSAGLMTAGFGGASSGFYQAPDGTYRQMNAKTIESQEARDHRSKYLTGKTIDQIAAANAMPGADAWVAKGKEVQSEQQHEETRRGFNEDATSVIPSRWKPRGPFDFPTSEERRAEIEHLKAILPKDSLLSDFLIRWAEGANSVMPYMRASVIPPLKGGRDAIVGLTKLPGDLAEWLTGEENDWGERIDAAVPAIRTDNGFEDIGSAIVQYGVPSGAVVKAAKAIPYIQRLPAAARYLASLGGLAATDVAVTDPEIATTLGNLIGGPTEVTEHDDAITARAKVGAETIVLAPVVQKLANAGIKAGLKIKGGIENLWKGVSSTEDLKFLQSLDHLLPGPDDYYTRGVARELPPGTGMIFVGEKPPKDPEIASYKFEQEALGQVWDIETHIPYKAALRFRTPFTGGKNLIVFDGQTVGIDHILFVERKRRFPWGKKEGMAKLLLGFARTREAIRQNNAAAGREVFKVIYEIDGEYEAARSEKLIIQTGNDDLIPVRVGKPLKDTE